jgi:hypothetical protein
LKRVRQRETRKIEIERNIKICERYVDEKTDRNKERTAAFNYESAPVRLVVS